MSYATGNGVNVSEDSQIPSRYPKQNGIATLDEEIYKLAKWLEELNIHQQRSASNIQLYIYIYTND